MAVLLQIFYNYGTVGLYFIISNVSNKFSDRKTVTKENTKDIIILSIYIKPENGTL